MDRILANGDLMGLFPIFEAEYLARDSFEHASLLLSCSDRVANAIKPFRFLKFWTEHENFKNVVRMN